MPEIIVSSSGTYDITQRIELTEEEWENAVNPETGKLHAIDIVGDVLFNDGEGGTLCANCSGWGRKYSMSLSDEREIYEVKLSDDKTVIFSDRESSSS